MEPKARKARRITSGTGPEKASDNIRLEPAANRQLTASAKKLKMSKSKYASAAIAFFAESGLDPTAERPEGLAGIGRKVDKETLAVRQQNVDIGNRLIGIIRGWEKNLYGFMQQQQVATNLYLENIESNLLKHQVAVETNFLVPMLEQIITGSKDAYIGRGVSTRVYLQMTTNSQDSWNGQNNRFSSERDEMLVTELQKVAKSHPMQPFRPTPKPGITQIPAKPVAATPAATPAPAVTPAPPKT
jgi:hypothetical protein